MESKLDANSVHRNTDRQRGGPYPRAIPYASYSETVIAREPVLIGLAVLAGVTLSILMARAIL
jgi:hypothetical protein